MILIKTGNISSPKGLAPKFCPNPKCRNHSQPSGKAWFCFRGLKKNNRHGTVRNYLCYLCGRSFSSPSFLISYYEKVSISYDVILSHVRKDINLQEWAREVGTRPGTLKLRLCKIGAVMLEELSSQCLPAAVTLIVEIHKMVQQGVKPYRILRELILRMKELLVIIHEKFSKSRAFLSSLLAEKKKLFCQLRLLCCSWCYRMSRGGFYYTRYQWE